MDTTPEGDETPPRSLFSRIWEYPLVHQAVDTAGDCYNYVKSYNSYSKSVFETAEAFATPIVSASLTKLDEYSHQPLVEGLIVRADAYGCQQLDKMEDGIQRIREVTPKAIKNVENAIHGSTVESLLIKTVGVVDNIVDTILPASQDGLEDREATQEEDKESDEEAGETTEDNTTIVTVTVPVLRKLRTRVSKESVLRIPIQTYSELKDLATRSTDGLPHLVGRYASFLHSASSYVLVTKQVTHNSLQKGAELSAASVDYVYHSLHRVTSSVSSLISIIKQLDSVEAHATITELSNMIADSKKNFSSLLGKVYSTQKLKKDCSAILQRAGDALSRPLEAGYTRVANSDITAIKHAFASLESAVQGIVERYQVGGLQNQPLVAQKEDLLSTLRLRGQFLKQLAAYFFHPMSLKY